MILEGVIEDIEDPDKNLAINGRGKEEVEFGYNKKGDFCFIEFVNNNSGYVGTSYFEKTKNQNFYYYWGVKGHDLKGYFDRSRAHLFSIRLKF